ncbi:MAG: hypothetical protein ACRD8O_03615 [Bryobacteraceae bacterium]
MSTHDFHGISFEATARLLPASIADVEAEQAIGCSFPPDYCEFVVQFGPGEFDEISVNVLPPFCVVDRLADDRDRLTEYWFWNDSELWNQKLALDPGCVTA